MCAVSHFQWTCRRRGELEKMKQLILIVVLIKCIHGLQTELPLVSTPKGEMRGVQSDDGDYKMFLGIPYAIVDEDDPFGPATPHPGFNGTYEANQDNIACPQVGTNYIKTVQCLQLNVYVPNSAKSTDTLPVLVYFHGGAFNMGNKARVKLSPRFMIQHDVIIVTISYRLGLYGFLCVSEPEYNNQGIKDQILALKWIKENIAAFGGDADKITAMGQSAGSMSIDILMLTQEGLFNRAILNSGVSLSNWVTTPQNDSIPIDTATALGFEGNDVKSAIQYLSKMDSDLVIQTTNDLGLLNYNEHPLPRPCIETVGDNAVLPDYPQNIKPKVKDLEILIGHTTQEAMFIYPNSDPEYYSNYKFDHELLFDFNKVDDEDIVQQFYIGDEKPSEKLQDTILSLASDLAFNYPIKRTVNRFLEAGAKKIYRYVFAYEGGRNGKDISGYTSAGTNHGDDLGYLFDADKYKEEINEEDQAMIDKMTTMWTNFIKYGDPTPTTSDLLPVQWQPTTPETRPYLNIDKTITMEGRPFHERLPFWDLYYKLHATENKGFNPNKQ